MKGKKVEIIEVGPRDGFQNVDDFIPTETKIKIIEGIIQSGIQRVQLTSFVNPKAVPQMRDAKEVTEYCLKNYPDINFFALVPNLKGAIAAVENGLKEITYVISVSQTHNQKNVKKTHSQSFDELKEILVQYPDLKVNLDVATTFGCPYEGKFTLEDILSFLNRAYEIGIRSFDLCDTVGLATPDEVKLIVEQTLKQFPECECQIHIHDTRNMGMINTYTAIESGITKIQTAIGGLGGCPFAPGASGNTSTEDFVYMLNKMGFETSVDFDKLLDTAKYLKNEVRGNYSGHHIYIDKDKVSTQ